MAFAFQSKKKLYLVLEFCTGGELFFHLQNLGAFDEKVAKFYSSSVLLALRHLHKHFIIYRDLKPENVLIADDGYIRLTDFGLSKENIRTNQATKSFCGTPEYLAPEVISQTGHGLAVDWWAFGCFLYEMLTGKPPFKMSKEDKVELFDNILNCRYQMPEHLSDECKDLFSKLFVLDPEKRLGGGPRGAADIMNHPWFAGINWKKMYYK